VTAYTTALSIEEEALTTRSECEASPRRNQVNVPQERGPKSRLRRETKQFLLE
jgi:hypothetical protein